MTGVKKLGAVGMLFLTGCYASPEAQAATAQAVADFFVGVLWVGLEVLRISAYAFCWH